MTVVSQTRMHPVKRLRQPSGGHASTHNSKHGDKNMGAPFSAKQWFTFYKVCWVSYGKEPDPDNNDPQQLSAAQKFMHWQRTSPNAIR